MEVKLDGKKTFTVTPAVTKELDKVTIVRIVDLPVEKKVRVFVRELGRPIDLAGLSDDNYGDWTDKKVADLLKAELAKL